MGIYRQIYLRNCRSTSCTPIFRVRIGYWDKYMVRDLIQSICRKDPRMKLKSFTAVLGQLTAVSLAGAILVLSQTQLYACAYDQQELSTFVKGDSTADANIHALSDKSCTHNNCIKSLTYKKKKDGDGVSDANMSFYSKICSGRSDLLSYSEQIIHVDNGHRQLIVAGKYPKNATITVMTIPEENMGGFLADESIFLCGYQIIIYSADGSTFHPADYGETIQISISDVVIPKCAAQKSLSVYHTIKETDYVSSTACSYRYKNKTVTITVTDLLEFFIVAESRTKDRMASSVYLSDYVVPEPFLPDSIYADDEEDEETAEDDSMDDVETSASSVGWDDGNLSIVYTIYSINEIKYYYIRAGDIVYYAI